jgi:hypothetical protein
LIKRTWVAAWKRLIHINELWHFRIQTVRRALQPANNLFTYFSRNFHDVIMSSDKVCLLYQGAVWVRVVK